MRIVPEVICSKPAIIRSVVVFPHPDGPTSTTNSRSAIERLIPSTARTPPGKILVRFSSSTWAIEQGRESIEEGRGKVVSQRDSVRASNIKHRTNMPFQDL